MHAGAPDLERAATGLASRLPEQLATFARLAYNYRWAWTPGGDELFAAIDPHRWELCGRNPVRLLQEVSADALAAPAPGAPLAARAPGAAGARPLARAGGVLAAVRDALDRSPAPGPVTPERPAAFFCAEY